MPTCYTYSFCFIPNCRMRARSYCSDWFTSHLVFRCPSNCLHLVTRQGIFWSYWQIWAYYIAVILLYIQFARFSINDIASIVGWIITPNFTNLQYLAAPPPLFEYILCMLQIISVKVLMILLISAGGQISARNLTFQVWNESQFFTNVAPKCALFGRKVFWSSGAYENLWWQSSFCFCRWDLMRLSCQVWNSQSLRPLLLCLSGIDPQVQPGVNLQFNYILSKTHVNLICAELHNIELNYLCDIVTNDRT